MANDFTKQFLAIADTLGPAAERATLTFVAVRRDEEFMLIEGRLMLDAVDQEPKHFRSVNVHAGHYRLSELKKSMAQVMDEIAVGRLELPDGDVVIPAAHEGGWRWEYDQSHPGGVQSRVEVMTVYGREREALFDQRLVNWELRAADLPFDTLIELANHYGLNFAQGSVRFEAVAPAIIMVDIEQRVSGREATLGVILSRGFDTDRAFLGYRVLVGKKVVDRGRVPGSSFEWKDERRLLRGLATLPVPEAAIVHCFAGYDGIVHNYGWILDPNNHQNARRVAYEAFDKDLTKLTEVLFRPPAAAHKNQQDDFEFAVSYLLWIRGYSVSLLSTSAIPGIKEGPDLLATTPNGHFVVVECTLGILKEDTKLARLVARATLMRQNLEKSGNPHLKVLPVMITSKSRSEVEAELEGALQLGVFVITREGIEEALRTSYLVPDPDREFDEGLKFTADAASKHSSNDPR